LNSAFDFDGTSSYIGIPTIDVSTGNQFTISVWVNPTDIVGMYNRNILRQDNGTGGIDWLIAFQDFGAHLTFGLQTGGVYSELDLPILASNYLNAWHNIIVVYDGTSRFIYCDNVLIGSDTKTGNVSFTPTATFVIGAAAPAPGAPERFIGKLDDVCIWSRALNQQEINNLFDSSSNCDLINSITLSSFGQYFWSTGDTATSVTINPGNLPFVWVSNGSCTDTIFFNSQSATVYDTSYVTISDTTFVTITDTSYVTITDTTYVTITDTTFITVTDTLVINALLTGLNPPNNTNTIKIFPNPTSTHITIDYGNYALMNGYTLRIENSLGQTVFTTFVTQQQSYIDLSTWNGNGIYFVHLIDASNNTLDIRKIVVQ
jgi:hypothetical protein